MHRGVPGRRRLICACAHREALGMRCGVVGRTKAVHVGDRVVNAGQDAKVWNRAGFVEPPVWGVSENFTRYTLGLRDAAMFKLML
ncbi:hypothetical protein AV530_015708 [Patagioenas fasciata monilis]|uniref:Uncharacterized protein n=1 Tax=Patagioenas fasciata monilis TaxID=372326 RepID=A0A1V4KIQ6_PATFA|nr:hypothetical protein AV530_015708 [Patagioenas fasciata monilis]